MYFSKFFWQVLLTAVVSCLVTACGGGGGGSAGSTTPPAAAVNVLPVSVDAGPTGNSANSLFATVTVCQPGSSNCVTIDHVLVDTGSTGLRLLSSLVAPLGLSPQTSAGLPLLNCAQFVDTSFVWGPVATADVVLGGMTASKVPIQIIGDPKYNARSAACQTGTAMNTVATLGANGILGVGLFLQDCGNHCTSNAANRYYFTCTTSACTATTGVTVSLDHQLQNPVSLLAAGYNNGLVIDLPAVTSNASVSGSIIFGVATQTNNQGSSGTKALATDTAGNVTTVLQGASMPKSFIDSGSNGLYFNSSAIASCTNANFSGFYCPNALTPLSATMSVTGPASTPASVTVAFAVDNAATPLSNAAWSVFPSLAGPSGDPSSFDWGLPFFFGRRVFFGFEGQSSTLGSGTYYAF